MWGGYAIVSKGAPKNKQNKLKQTKKDEIKEEIYLNYATIIKYGFCFLVCLFFNISWRWSDKLAKQSKCIYFVFIF